MSRDAPQPATPPNLSRPVRSVSRARRWVMGVCVAAVAFLLAGTLCELILWVVAPVPFHEFLNYQYDGHVRVRPVPDQLIDNGAGYKVRINRHGFRGPDYPLEKPAGTLRIVVFGGSAAFDFKASSEDKSWPGAIQKKLAERLAMPVEVINLAVPGYDSFNCKIHYMYTGRNFQPDAAILYEGWNDMGVFRQLEKEPYGGVAALPNQPLWARVARASQIGRRLHPVVRRLQGRLYDDILAVDKGAAGDMDRPADVAALEWDQRNFRDFILLARSDGVLPVVASMAFLGSRGNLDDPEIQRMLAQGCYQRGFTQARAVETLEKLSEMVAEVAREHDAIFVDGYGAVPHDLRHIRDNVHLYDAGSEALAAEFVRVFLNDPRFMKLVQRVRAERPARGPGGSR